MSGISRIGNSYQNLNVYQRRQAEKQQEKAARDTASGKKLNQASDGAAEMSIAKKLAKSAKSMEVGNWNLKTAQSALNIADGAMGGITDSLQRMNELSIRAGSGLMSDDDKRALQDEVNQLKDGVNEGSRQAQYNERELLSEDGSVTLVSGDNGTTSEFTTAAINSGTLGIENFDVTEGADTDTVKEAISSVVSQRATAGAQTNQMESAQNYNAIATENTTAALSSLEDADIAEEMMAMSTGKNLSAVQLMLQKREEEEAQTKSAAVLAQ